MRTILCRKSSLACTEICHERSNPMRTPAFTRGCAVSCDSSLIYVVESKSQFTVLSPDVFRKQHSIANAVTEMSLFAERKATPAEKPSAGDVRQAEDEWLSTAPTTKA